METVREQLAREVAIKLKAPDRSQLEAIGEILSRYRGDRKVSFELEINGGPRKLRVRADLSTQIRVKPTRALINEVEQVAGVGTVELR